MIVKMSKITLLVDETNVKKALKDLRKLGVLHVKPLPNPPSSDMATIETRIEDTKHVLHELGEADEAKQKGSGQAAKIVDELLEKMKTRSALERELDVLLEAERWYAEWSEISLKDLKELEDEGLYLKLYQISPSAWKEIENNENLFALSVSKENVKLALVSRDPEDVLDFRPVNVPDISYKDAIRRKKEIEKEKAAIEKVIDDHRRHIDLIKVYLSELQKDKQFASIQNGLGIQESIAYLQGFVPAEEAKTIEKAAEKKGWGYVEEEPSAEDNPPTKLKNAKWIKIIEPVFDFLGTVPGYREKDISMYFLIFFAIFVAMIIGDAGYGSIFLLVSIAATIGMKRGGKKLPGAIILLYVLSITTMTWGAITGTWFGSVAIAQIPFFKSLIIPQIASFPEVFPNIEVNPQEKVQLICFILAIIQLGLASILNFIDNLPKLKAFEHLGWFAMTTGAFTLVLNLVLGMPMPSWSIYVLAAGFILIVMFSAQEDGKSFVKGLLGGLGGAFNTFLDAISSFSNIISYIRLFAVGMATVAIASSFNDMAAGMMHGPAIIGGIIVLLIGHGLNIIMGLLSVMVHGIRLNLLEFSGQLGLEWTGYKYEPFKDK
jgi:V/A-type H+-transporting ATPase subunit I